MICAQCKTEYTTLSCPSCGTNLDVDRCPTCLEGEVVVCKNCSKAMQLRRKSDPGALVAQPQSDTAAKDIYAYQPPTEKTKLGGWLIAFIIFNVALLVYNIGTLVYSLIIMPATQDAATGGIGGIIFTIVLQLALYIVPAIVMLFYVFERDERYRRWYTAIMVISIVITIVSIASTAITLATLPRMQEMMQDPAIQAQLGSDAAAATDALVNLNTGRMIGELVFSTLITMAHIAFFVYLRKSPRVAYTFDPLNNPPKGA